MYAAALPLVWAASAQAIGLGDISAQSALGRPLRVVVPLIVAGDDVLSGECFKLSPAGRASDGIPELQTGRVALERIGSRAQIVLSTSRAVNDPLLRLTLQAGCDNPVRREYMLMLDPAAIDAPVVAIEDTTTRADIVAPTVPSATLRADANVHARAGSAPACRARVLRFRVHLVRLWASMVNRRSARAPPRPPKQPRPGSHASPTVCRVVAAIHHIDGRAGGCRRQSG
jgi:pilus assembly protein FimV